MNNDDNFLHFLTDKMTKDKIYPPQKLAKNLSKEEVFKSWQALSQKIKLKELKGHNLGIYLHFPFCLSKCRFCYCHSAQESDFNIINDYVDKMLSEINYFSRALKSIAINTLYVGGGTPSYLSIDLIEKVFKRLFEKFKIDSSNWQFNFEASPLTLTKEKLDLLKNFGVNRLSMGVQSLNKKVLNNINRKQSYEMIEDIVRYSRKIGIAYVNLDYVAGLPGETLQSFLAGFLRFIKIRPDIVHLYKFYPADNTIFFKEGMIYGDQEIKLRQKMIDLGEKIVKKNGYKIIRNEFEAWGLNLKARNEQDAGRKEKPYSILGLGSYAKSHIFNILHYQSGANHYFNKLGYEYKGNYVNEKDEMSHFILSTGRGGFKISEFEEIFKMNPLEVFDDEFNYLKNNNKLKIESNLIRIMTNDSNEYHFLIKKLFYSQEIIDELKEYYQNEYNSNKNYQRILESRIVDRF